MVIKTIILHNFGDMNSEIFNNIFSDLKKQHKQCKFEIGEPIKTLAKFKLGFFRRRPIFNASSILSYIYSFNNDCNNNFNNRDVKESKHIKSENNGDIKESKHDNNRNIRKNNCKNSRHARNKTIDTKENTNNSEYNSRDIKESGTNETNINKTIAHYIITDHLLVKEKSITSSLYGGLCRSDQRVLIMSCARLKNYETIITVVNHELGHLFGLGHCDDEKCIMKSGTHGENVVATNYWCKNCSFIFSS